MRALIIQHVEMEGPGLLLNLLVNQHWQLDIRCMDQPNAVLPESLDNYQAYIILGGPINAYQEDQYPYLVQVQELIRQAAARKIPTLGICLGGQLIARSLGAGVFRNQVTEIGWTNIRVVTSWGQKSLFEELPPELPVFQWHSDTFELPEGAELMAWGRDCFNQAFVYGGNMWALQFHLEVTPAMIGKWADLYRSELSEYAGPGAAARLVRNTEARWEAMKPWRDKFLQNVADMLQPG